MKSTAQSTADKLIVFTQNTPYETEFDGKVDDVELNGIRLKNVHDLTVLVERQTHAIKRLWVCGIVAVVCLGLLASLHFWHLNYGHSTADILPPRQGGPLKMGE